MASIAESFYKNVLRPALAAVGLPASRPATTAPDGARVPAVRGVRLHDLTAYVRHDAAVGGGISCRCPSGWGTAVLLR